jgi:dipeptide transport system ATP-binding protein
VVRYIADDVLVMYLGLVMEHAPKEQLFTAPKHPYTQALLAATPSIERTAEKRHALRGDPPSPLAPPPGCVFASRCPLVFDRCRTERPQLRHIEGRQVACHLA